MKFIALILLLCHIPGLSQIQDRSVNKQRQVIPMNGLNGSHKSFIKNIGQYDDTIAGHKEMSAIKYGYESDMVMQ
jgi:hypothetical protein